MVGLLRLQTGYRVELTIMAYSENLAKRLRGLLRNLQEYREQKMFGGIAFLLHGNLCCGVHEDKLILRLNTCALITDVTHKLNPPQRGERS